MSNTSTTCSTTLPASTIPVRGTTSRIISLIEGLAELSDVQLEYEYPELLAAAPALTLAEAIDLHRRWATEAAAVLFAHPVPAGLR